MSLVPTNGGYWLLERHGRTFKFGTNNLVSSIADPYGRAMNFTYNASNWVATVTDWTNRSLTFSYLGGVLTNVADSAGRSVSYGYTGGNMTSFTDAEGKTNGYTYDANHQVVATLDALGRLVVTNAYDGFGHVTTQLTQGDPNKTWQIYASGYYTVEVDPAGGAAGVYVRQQVKVDCRPGRLGQGHANGL
jgi:YD repeat-containing protein